MSLNAVKTLPEHYHLVRSIDLSRQIGLLIILNVVGLILFFFWGGVFFWAGVAIRSGAGLGMPDEGMFQNPLILLLGAVAVYLSAIVVHEIIHGFFFKLLTHEWPKFGMRSVYAYAAAPDWYLPRNRYIWVGISPLLFISLAGFFLLPFLPGEALVGWWFFLTVNASGAVGDLYVVGSLLQLPSNVLVNDEGDSMHFYLPR